MGCASREGLGLVLYDVMPLSFCLTGYDLLQRLGTRKSLRGIGVRKLSCCLGGRLVFVPLSHRDRCLCICSAGVVHLRSRSACGLLCLVLRSLILEQRSRHVQCCQSVNLQRSLFGLPQLKMDLLTKRCSKAPQDA